MGVYCTYGVDESRELCGTIVCLALSAIERWNNEPCLSIFQGSRMQAGDRLGREAVARSVDEILVSCADTYRSIRTLILIYSV